MNKTEEPKFDIKLELIKCELCNKMLRVQGAILGSIREWGEKYREKGELEYQRACNILTRLLKAISRLTESETNAIITLIDPNICWDSENINSIIESENKGLKQLAGILYLFTRPPKELPDVLW